MRQHLVDGVIQYFRSSQWLEFLHGHLLREGKNEVYHIHLYTETSIHPDSLNEILGRYFTAVGHPYDRHPHPQAPRPGIITIHGIHSPGCPHWEMILRFNPEVILSAAPEDSPYAEHGSNLVSWDRECMNAFVREIPFQVVGPREEAEIEAYFRSRHWKEAVAYVLDETVTHVHPNLEICFDPKIFELFANRAMERMGWTVEKVVPCIFDIRNLTKNKQLAEDDPIREYKYMGKINYLLGYPEKMFDFAWLFNPDTVIRPAVRGWAFEVPGFDVWRITNYDSLVAQSAYIRLDPEEIGAIAASLSPA